MIPSHRIPAHPGKILKEEFLDEMARFHLGEHVEPFEHPIGFGNQRLADVIARKMVAFEQQHGVSLLGEQGCGRGAGRSTADHHDVEGIHAAARGFFFVVHRLTLRAACAPGPRAPL